MEGLDENGGDLREGGGDVREKGMGLNGGGVGALEERRNKGAYQRKSGET